MADDSNYCETHDSSALVVETNITDLSIQNMVDEKQSPQLTESNNQNLESSMMKEEAVVDTQTLDQNAVDVDGHHPDRSIFAIPSQDSLEGGSVVKGLDAELSSLEDSMGTRTVAVSDMQKEERCSEDIRSCDLTRAKASENSVSLKDTVMDDQSISDTHTSPMVSVKDDLVSVEQVVEVVEVSNSSCEVCPNLQQTELQLLCSLLALEGAVRDLTSSAMDELRTFSEAIKALLTTSANGASILRVLQALSSFVTSSTEKENDGISRAHLEFSEINSA